MIIVKTKIAKDTNERATDAAPPVLGTAVGEALGDGANPQVVAGDSGSNVTRPRRVVPAGVVYTRRASRLL
jgi:hypothetical protein